MPGLLCMGVRAYISSPLCSSIFKFVVVAFLFAAVPLLLLVLFRRRECDSEKMKFSTEFDEYEMVH